MSRQVFANRENFRSSGDIMIDVRWATGQPLQRDTCGSLHLASGPRSAAAASLI